MNGALDKGIDFVIHHSKLVEKVFVIFVIISLICMPFVGVNYDLSKYLPNSAPSKQGLDLMEETFGYPGTARVMIKDVSVYEAKHYKDRIAAVNGVDLVMWADTSADLYESESFLQTKDLKDYYKDGCAVMDVTFVEGDSSKKTHKAIDEIMEITGEKGYFGGASVQNKSLEETMLREISIAMAMGVVMIAVILCITTTSWFEPILFLLIMGIAIVINMGTNIILGTISFLTFSMAAILQLAIAMDYSIFLLHTFTREKNSGMGVEEALANAIRLSVSSILSSGATTIVGFIVLTLMQFSIGRDLGIVLAKGIVVSLLTVLLLMPALILRWSDRVDRTQHKPFIPSLEKLSRGIFKIRWPFFILILLILLPCYVAQNMNIFRFGNDALGASPGTRVFSDEQEINAKFGRSNLVLVLVPNDGIVLERELTDALEELPFTKSVTSLAGSIPEGVPESILPKSLTGQLHKKGYARLLVPIRTSAESPVAYDAVRKLEEVVKDYYPQGAHVVGVTPSTMDIEKVITKDYSYVNVLSLLGVALVVLITFRSLMIPIVVMIPIEVAIFINMALPYILGDELVFMGYLIVSCLQLGATVDYSILLTNNYLDFRTEIADKKQAAVAAISRSALSILTSGSILTTVGYLLYFSSSVAAIANMGRLVGRGALFSMILVLCMLPMLLTIFDKAINNQLRRVAKRQKIHELRRRRHVLHLQGRKESLDKALKNICRLSGDVVFYEEDGKEIHAPDKLTRIKLLRKERKESLRPLEEERKAQQAELKAQEQNIRKGVLTVPGGLLTEPEAPAETEQQLEERTLTEQDLDEFTGMEQNPEVSTEEAPEAETKEEHDHAL